MYNKADLCGAAVKSCPLVEPAVFQEVVAHGASVITPRGDHVQATVTRHNVIPITLSARFYKYKQTDAGLF